jgi:hypothetical protein
MKLNYRKISAVLSSALMIGSSIGIAAAAQNYPAPFVVGGAADVGIVYGTGEGVSILDAVAAGNIQADLQSKMSTTSGGTDASTTGETAALFTGSTKLYINDSLNAVKNVLTETEMPTVLGDGSFSGNVDASYTQTLDIGSNPKVTFAKGPTSSDDPEYGLSVSTTSANYIYNATITFNKAVNFTHADSQGESIELFGQTYTVSSATSATALVLLQSAERASLDTDNPTSEVTISGKTYTVELVSASDTAATIRVTDSDGVSADKEVNEAQSKKINGVTVAVISADETNLKLSASVVVGSEKVTLTTGSTVTYGEDDAAIEGTSVLFTGGTTAMTKMSISVVAPNSDEDYIKPDGEFVDPVFKTFKLDFSGINVPADSTAREDIKISNSGDDKMLITMTDSKGNELSGFQWAFNQSTSMQLMGDEDARNISVKERETILRNEWVVVGNEDEGFLLRASTITNISTPATSSDSVKFTDVFSGTTYETTITTDGTGTVTIGGKVYQVNYGGTSSADSNWVKLNYPDSSASDSMVIYPTIQTSKGAKVAFYEPAHINLSNWDGDETDLATVRIPDGDGYEDVDITVGGTAGNFTVDGTEVNSGTVMGKLVTVGNGLTFNFTYTRANETTVYLVEPDSNGGHIVNPALIIWEEKDDNSEYQAMVVTLEEGATSDDGIGVSDVLRSWDLDSSLWEISLASDSKVTKEATLYGSLITLDSADSDQKIATISYPDEQVYAQIYMAGVDATITAGTTGTGSVTALGTVTYKDSEVNSVKAKNLIVVGGSCINSAAANLLGGAYCGASFTEQTGVGSGQYLIQSFGDAYTDGQIALLVAGYDAADTQNAQKFLTGKTVDTTADNKYIGTSATEATMQTASSDDDADADAEA